jgi:hypothetical protein
MSTRHPSWMHHVPDSRPVAYGYLRLDSPDEPFIALLRTTIEEFCVTQNLRLVTTFCDRGSDGMESARPGLSGLLDVLRTVHRAVVVTPKLTHLSPDEALRAALTRQVVRLGSRVAIVEDTRTALAEAVAGGDAADLPYGDSGSVELVWNSDDTLRLQIGDDDVEAGASS